MSGLVKTGISGLDDILLGGIPRNNNLIVEGPPGSGKTTLGLGFIYHGARDYDEPGAIVSFELDRPSCCATPPASIGTCRA